MRTLVISDIHANLSALETVIAAAGQFDAVICLGDLVGYGPKPNECVQLVRIQPEVTCVIGNHDVAALGRLDLNTFNPLAKRAAIWTQRALSDESKQFLEELDEMTESDGLTLVHGSPRDPVWEYLDEIQQAPENFARFSTHDCLVGHTHVPRVFSLDPDSLSYRVYVPQEEEVLCLRDPIRRILNPGSVGQPRDGDCRAAFAVMEDSGEFTLRRVEYDIAATQQQMSEAGLPQELADRLSYGY